MSEFDKEKEREKLREKYEQDEEERESAEKMSELLLQGATMTNAHCSECGDPIFRYDGQEFCATCEKPVDRGEQGDDEATDDDADDQIEVTDPGDEARVAFGGPEDTSQEAASEEQAAGRDPSPAPAEGPEPSPAEQRRVAGGQSAEATRRVPGIDPSEGNTAPARESLVATLNRFSQQAAATEDPQRAQEYLAAAREAAEALAALRR